MASSFLGAENGGTVIRVGVYFAGHRIALR